MINEALLHTVNSILGKGRETSNNNYAYKCPFPNCPSHAKHNKLKLEINLQPNSKGETPWHCWVCNSKGKTLTGLFKKLKVTSDKLSELRSILGFTQKTKADEEHKVYNVELPKEYKPLVNLSRTDIAAKHALVYLKKRGITKSDILKYNIGYCESGKYANRIIIPSYDKNGNLNYFIARAFDDNPRKYDAPKCNKNEIIGFEYFINWNIPVILCEGIFDAIAIKRNAVPLLGKTIPKALMMQLIQPNVKTVYVSLDRDALKDALSYAEQLLNLGKDVYLIDLQDKDPSEMGFEKFTKLVHEAEQLSLGELIYKKLELA